jgi:hypothetical protein
VGSSLLLSNVGSIEVNSDSVVGSIVSSKVGDDVEVSVNSVGSIDASSVGIAVFRTAPSAGERVRKLLLGRRVRFLNGVFVAV